MSTRPPAAPPEDTAASGPEAQAGGARSGDDLIVFNAKIFTGNLAQTEASAFAVKTGRIHGVGAGDDILALQRPGTRIIDAGGRRRMPGVNDVRIHLLNEANRICDVRWGGLPTPRRALAMLSEQAAGTPDGRRVKALGGGIALDPRMASHGDAFIKTHGAGEGFGNAAPARDGRQLAAARDDADAVRASTLNLRATPRATPRGRHQPDGHGGNRSPAPRFRVKAIVSRAARRRTCSPAAPHGSRTRRPRWAGSRRGVPLDFAVPNRDRVSVPADEIKHVRSVLTVLDGRVVFGAQDDGDLAPAPPEILSIRSPIKYYGGYHGDK